MTHDKEYAPSASELMVARDAALEALAWSTPTGCDIRATRSDGYLNTEADEHRVINGGLHYDVVCYYCSSDCECKRNGWACRTQAEQVADGHPDADGPLNSYHDNPTAPTYYLPEMMDGLPFDWDDEAKATMLTEVEAFISGNNADLHGIDYGQIGHDITLTRNGHGAGFWDRGHPDDVARRLTESAKALGEANMYADFEAKTYKLEG